MANFVSETLERPKPAPLRFQFTLSDLLFVTGLTVLGNALFFPWIGESFTSVSLSGKPLSPFGPFICNLVIFVATCFGASLGFWRAKATKRTGWRRLMTTAAITPAGWFFLMFFIPPLYTAAGWRNEWSVVVLCKEYVETQEIHRRCDFRGDGVFDFAQSLKGNDSLLEKTAGACDLALIDRTFASAEGLPGKVPPKAGYVFKVLKAQGPAARGGAKSYLKTDPNGKLRMTEGHALAACPAHYDVSGLHTYMINQDGLLYCADLGEQTAKIFEEMTEFNPDSTWQPANE